MRGFAESAGPLLSALEAMAMERGNTRYTLTSTETARQFYQARGYVEVGLPVRQLRNEFGLSDGQGSSVEYALNCQPPAVSGEEVAARASQRNPYASREPFVTGSLGGRKMVPQRHRQKQNDKVNEEDEFEDE